MKKKEKKQNRWLCFFLVWALVCTSIGIIVPSTKVDASGYDYAKAVEYAKQWGGSKRNTAEYLDFTNDGGDCINFVSQCLRAGGLETGDDWKPYVSGWTWVPTFVQVMQNRGYQVIENPTADQIYPGNPVIYWWSNKNDWSHATICIGKNENGVPVITGHTGDIDSEVWNYAVGRSSKMCTILINNGDWQTGDPVNLGDNFYAYIQSALANKPLTNDSNNVAIRSYGYSNDEIKSQIWKFVRQSDGSYVIYSCLDGNVLEVQGAAAGSGANVQTLGYWGHPAQHWFIYGSPGEYRLKAQCTDCILDIANSGKDDGTNVQMCAYNGYPAQVFSIDKVGSTIILPDTPSDLGNNFYAYINSNMANKVLTNDLGNVSIRSKGSGETIKKQVWNFVRQDDGSYVIYSCYDGKVLDVDGAGTKSGTNVQTYKYWKSPAQHWYLYGSTSSCQLKSQCSECILDIANGDSVEGTNVQMCRSNGNLAQLFYIEKTTNPTVIKVSKITLNKTDICLSKGKSLKLSATISPSNASNKNVAWTSSNTKIVSVDSNGKITAKSAGTATITCKAKDGSGVKKTCKVKVYTNTEEFVARIYTKALNREPEAGGLAYWTKEIQTGARTPVNVAESFFFSPEFTKKNLSNTEYVKVLYRTFMGREYDQAGLNYWVGRLNRGESRKTILKSFAGCPEFQKIVKSFGL